MAFTPEDGSGVPGANSYLDEAELEAYADDRGLTLAAGADAEQALVRASAALDALYRSRYPGVRAFGRDQGLEWPRIGALDVEGEAIDDDVVPFEIQNATAELAAREMATPGSVLPDVGPGGPPKSLKAGSVAIEYGANATAYSVFTIVDGILSSLLVGSSDGGMFATTIRG